MQAVVREAKARKRRLTIKNGGHSDEASITDGGILLDLSQMKNVKLDMTTGAEQVTWQGGGRAGAMRTRRW